MAAISPKKRAFTIVEILVTITIIGLLLGLLLPALSGVKRQSRKRTEANNLKQVHLAWMLYANHSNDAAVPGYMDIDVQYDWKCRYEFPDQSQVPPFIGCPCPPVKNITGPWTWRLMKFLDYTPGIVEFYEESALAATLPAIDQEWVMHHVIEGPGNPDCERYERAHAMAEAPIFGYNGFYVGGYWTMQNVGGTQTPKYEYFNHCESNNPNPNYRPRVAVATSIPQIRRSSELVTFCAATRFDSTGMNGKLFDERPGTYLVTPPFMGTTPQWKLPAQIDGEHVVAGDVEVMNLGIPNITTGNHAGVPFTRYGGGAATLFADGHIDQQNYHSLFDMRKWVDNATTVNFQHTTCP
jgi:prepilin-type N-terminal cleavage/methylation domain-containing protein/prepilin-type processing-associated H-X9-DG protein